MYREAVDALREAVARLAALSPAELSDPELVVTLAELHELESQLRAAEVSCLTVAHPRSTTTEVCGRTTKSFLVEELLLAPAEASRRLTMARELPFAPEGLGDAFATGDITADHVTTILPVLRHLPAQHCDAVTDALVDLARELPPPALAECVDQVLDALGVEAAAERHARRYGRRGVTLATTFGGTGSLAGTLTPEVRESVALALKAASAHCGPEDDRSTSQRNHDGLGEIAKFYLANADLPEVNGAPVQIVVTMRHLDLVHHLEEQWPILGSGTAISPETARRLACDAKIIPAVLGSRGEPLDLGHSTPRFTTSIRRAAILRDGHGCVFPSCTRPPREAHHIQWVSLGGATSLTNCAWLCAYHHWLVHEGGWSMRRDPGGGYTFTSRAGRVVTSIRQPEVVAPPAVPAPQPESLGRTGLPALR